MKSKQRLIIEQMRQAAKSQAFAGARLCQQTGSRRKGRWQSLWCQKAS